jgi:integrase
MIMLTEVALKNLKPKEKSYKMADSGGLYIEVTPAGGKSWKLKYHYLGKEKKLTIGPYPIVSLKMAREKALEAKELLAQGIDPSAVKKEAKALNIERANNQHEAEKQALTFETLFHKWYDTRTHEWSESHSMKVMQRVRNHLLPFIGEMSVDEIKPATMIETLKRLDDAGKTHMRMKVKGIASMVYKFGIGYGLTSNDPTASIPDSIFKSHITKHYATVTDPKAIREVLSKLKLCNDNSSVCAALKLAPYVFLRPSELVGLRWDEIDFDDKLIRIKANRMKMDQDHLIPMSNQVCTLLKERLVFKSGDYVFVNFATYQPINPESIRQRIRRLGIDKETLTPHGFRHMASTRLNEMGFSSDAIERQLSHTEVNAVRRAYNHAEYLPERIRMMQAWADWLEASI